ncbi:hypothetical protein [Coprothermobacter platensis]|uniref:hypothetical protein n=1 Tax=Coprothermobacter platensis TaxID=108819 RepID=UPI000372D136|nr:hypothetical protein [Coprothermobacter platensis]
MFRIELILGKRDVGVVQTLVEGLDNAYSLMGTSKLSDDSYKMIIQATEYLFKELMGVIIDCMLSGNVKSFSVTVWNS